MSDTSKDPEAAQRMLALKMEQMDATTIALKSELDALRAERAAEKAKAIDSHVDSLVKSGHVLEAQRANAVWAFTQDYKQASEIFANKVVPIGVMQIEPEKKVLAADGSIDMSALSEDERASVLMMTGLNGRTREKAYADVIALRAAGKVN
jgi:phage I-like protein